MKPALPARPNASRQPPVAPPTNVVRSADRGMDMTLWIAVLLAMVAGTIYEHRQQVEGALGQARQALHAMIASPAQQHPPGEHAASAAQSAATSGPARLAQKVMERAAALASSPLHEVTDLSRESLEARIGPSGQVLMTSKYRVLQLNPGNSDHPLTLLDATRYRERFPDARMQAMASSLALPGERYLLGGWHGEVLLASGERLTRLSGRNKRPKGRIADLREWNRHVLVAGDGLWRLNAAGSGLEEVPLPGLRRLRTLGAQGEQLLIAEAGGAIHQWTGDRVQPWLSLPQRQVEALVPTADGGWWIASTNGLYRASDDGRLLQTLLPGVWTTAVLERPDELWVGSWRQGLLLYRGGQWYRLGSGLKGLKADAVSDLALDGSDHLWLALYGGGGWHAALDELRPYLLDRPWTPVPDPQN